MSTGHRGQGRAYRPKKRREKRGPLEVSPAYMLDYTVNGERYREAAGTEEYQEALAILARRREARRNGAPAPKPVPATLAAFIEEHLAEKATHEEVTEGWIEESRHQLDRAVTHFGAQRRLPSITPQDVLAFDVALKDGTALTNGRRLSPGTRRHHLNALSNLFQFAVFKQVVTSNPVAAIPAKRKPSGSPDEALWLEPPEAALLLAAARTQEPEPDAVGLPPMPFAYELLATFLLTGGRQDEVLGLEVDDIDFDNKRVTFRPNRWRRLKTPKSARTVPLWPQLEAILRPYVFGSDSPPARLLFPSYRTGEEAMLTDVRKLIDRVTERASTLYLMDQGRRRKAEPGDIRTKVFRHSYISARLQTLDNRKPVAAFTVASEVGHSSTAMIEKTYGHLGQARHRANVVEFRPEQHKASLEDRLARLPLLRQPGAGRKSRKLLGASSSAG